MWAIISIVGVLLFLCAAYYLYHLINDVPGCEKCQNPSLFEFDYDAVKIPTSTGKSLHAWYIPAKYEKNSPFLIMLHGWGKDASSLLPLLPVFHDAGINVLAPDASSHGESDRSGNSNILQFSQDFIDCIQWLNTEKNPAGNSIFLLGHSLAGAAAIKLASENRIACVITIGVYAHAIQTLRRYMRSVSIIPYWPIGWLVMRFMQFQLGQTYDQLAPMNCITKSHIPVLLVHGEQDELVDISNAYRIAKSADSKLVNVVSVATAGHNSLRRYREKAGTEMLEFLLNSTFCG